MRFGASIFLLLTIGVQLFSALNIDCDGNTYNNDQLLLSKLKGYLFTVYTSVAYSNNEIFKFYPIHKNHILTRTTNDAKCCKTMNISTISEFGKSVGDRGGYYKYSISNDKDCATHLTETAHLKLLASNTDTDGSYCVVLWTCRISREGVHAFCTKKKVSDRQRKWISFQYNRLRLTEIKVKHSTDYKNGKCFRK